ncbi:glycosyltransferase family 4 protein [Chloroflexus sp.]|uniref:glycosyltransferase family 4 protein n=1 Tax=Chloroflexus sp. TaxID=1904827 RepID=UPI0026190C79|nr:glycosyltransferase family 4 protein [uncultured Chloroflexus sp.]
MRVLYILPRYDRTAIANQIHTEIIYTWRSFGIEAEILSFSSQYRSPLRSVEDGVVVHRWPSSGSLPKRIANRLLYALFPYPFLFSLIEGMHRLLTAVAPFDLCHVETAFPLGWAAVLAGRHMPPLAITLPGADVMSEPKFDYGYARFRSVRVILPKVFQQALVIRADSPMIRDRAIHLGAPAFKVKAIPYNITNSSLPPPDVPIDSFRSHCREMVVKRHQLTPDQPIVISLNRLHPFKGIVYLVEALPTVRAAGLRPQVLIIGPNRVTPTFGDYAAFLRRRAVELGVADQVMLIGAIPQEEAIKYLAAADVAVVPSVAEAFSRVVIEACAVGTPPVVTSTTGASVYVAAAQAGIVVEPCSGQAIGEAIIRLLRDSATWQTFSAHGVMLAPKFTSTQVATELAHLYYAALRGDYKSDSVLF